MTNKEFSLFRKLLYSEYGIYFDDSKKGILKIKVDKLLRMNNMNSYRDYYELLKNPIEKQHLIDFLNIMTVNKTHFFREQNHFDFIKENLSEILQKNPMILKEKKIRVWSSASSTGEEAYSIAILLNEIMPKDIEIKILGTDISQRALKIAIKGRYSPIIKKQIPKYYLHKYFVKIGEEYIVKSNLKKMVQFRGFNLKDEFPFKNGIDIIFCRNVMIYFDEIFKEELINKFYKITPKGGLLFIGHSETIRNLKHKYKYIKPTIYIR